MIRKTTMLIIGGLLVILTNLNGQTIESPAYIPEGWRIPTATDIIKGSGWQEMINQDSKLIPYYVNGDFNGDGKEDFCWLLINSDNSSWSLYAFIKNQSDGYANYLIGRKGIIGKNPTFISSSAVSECIIQKAIKGESLCLFGNNDSIIKKITTQYDAIVFSVFEVGQPCFFYFDKSLKKFVSYWSCSNDGD
jgi:hypothetical protein